MTSGESGSSVTSVSVAVRLPVAVGVQVRVKVSSWPRIPTVEGSPVTTNSEAFVPVLSALVTLSVRNPSF